MMRYYFKRLDESEIVMIKELFVSVFTKEPWNDDWSDENQLELYLQYANTLFSVNKKI